MIKSLVSLFVDATQQQKHNVVEPAAPEPDEEEAGV
jgi:hypothetical protein